MKGFTVLNRVEPLLNYSRFTVLNRVEPLLNYH